MVPIAHEELAGQSRTIKNPKSTVSTPSERIQPDPGRGRVWKKNTIRITPSAKKIPASTNVRACRLRPGLAAR